MLKNKAYHSLSNNIITQNKIIKQRKQSKVTYTQLVCLQANKVAVFLVSFSNALKIVVMDVPLSFRPVAQRISLANAQ